VDFDAFMNNLRSWCQDLPEAEEYLMHGHPSFRAGKKAFVIGWEGDATTPATMSVNHGLFDQSLLLDDPRFTRTHYIGQHGWVTIALSELRGPEELRALVLGSYRRAATKRALKALDARQPV
jgi:hypothetical protein